MSLKLIKLYIKFKETAEEYIGNPWKDEEMKSIVHREIVKLNIVELLHEAVDTGWITCPECEDKVQIRSGQRSCGKCGWLNPLYALMNI